ncbi:hypothetical protein [Mucilaginibacter sp. UR6-11]|uniref:hypothetical protein n=1 Tax=Mucilaginibacter sp. UR6-11 TaxID=1435644 RepID=UPI001E5B7BCD|nr:hypothetical protein [Mucilaginibacter sp. UR6-11]MCC8425802.1 hypothetical protein [Mucilaginibacter sp. UR6-11]
MVDFADLYFKGFDRKFYTSSELAETGITRYYCFELGWEDLNETRLLVNFKRLEIFNINDPDYYNYPPPTARE